ncbi:MFS transporter [Kitasatospora indigofera]|uniref:MFS transporter n=1 Tax=Kitasatospora indigofera TaxID=67307 RepID=UPI00363688F6
MEPVTTPAPHNPGLRRVLRAPHVTPLLAGTLTGRLPTAMAPITLLLTVRAEGGPIALGGALAALYAVASAIGQPLLGRLVDRTRLAPVAAASAAVATAAFAALAALGCTPHPFTAAVLAVVAGASTPPLEAGLRAMWPRLLPDPGEQRAAFALDSISQQMVFVVGPLAATALSQLLSPSVAMAGSAVVGAVGCLAVVTTSPARWRTAVRRQVHWMGPLRSRGLLLLLSSLFFLGVSLGAFNVLAITLGDLHHSGWLAGLVPAAYSLGSVVGGIAYARARWPAPLVSQLLFAATGYALAFIPLGHVSAAPLALALAASFLPGLFLAPLLVCSFILTDRLAPDGTATEAGAWLIAVIGAGQAFGSAAAGPLASLGTGAVAALPAVSAAVTAAVLLARRDLLIPANTPPEKPA